jgi:hypothetical protein
MTNHAVERVVENHKQLLKISFGAQKVQIYMYDNKCQI